MDRPAMSYLAIVSERPDRLSDFYQTYFGLTELGRSDAGDVSVTDGHFNLTFLKRRAGLDEDEAGPGLHHFGIAVEDIDEIKARLKEYAPFANLREESGDLHHGEYRVTDPNGYPVSVSTRHFGVTPRPRGFPSLRHIALSVPNREEVTAFFVNVFGFRETSVSQQRRATNQPARHLGDGTTNLAVLPDPDLIRQLGEEREVPAEYQAINTRPGPAHFGFVVQDMDAIMDRMPPELSGATNKRPNRRDMAECRVFDPEWNGIDLSQRLGFEVEFDKWVRAD